jgi:hypothetical protein
VQQTDQERAQRSGARKRDNGARPERAATTAAEPIELTVLSEEAPTERSSTTAAMQRRGRCSRAKVAPPKA